MEAAKQTKVRVIEVAMIGSKVLVTFSDGRITLLEGDDLYQESTEAPVYPNAE